MRTVSFAFAALFAPLILTATIASADAAEAKAPASSTPATSTPATPFLAHRAVYELSLGSTVGDKAPSSAKGLISYEFTGSACTGYITNFRQMTAIDPPDGAQRISDMRSSTFEDGAAKDFRFKIETSVDDVKQEDLDGHATRGGNGDLLIALARPKREKFDFKPGIVFPTEHLEDVIAAAKAGKHDFSVKAYDGSETGSKVYDTFTIIGNAISTPADDAGGTNAALKSVARWPVTISYFDPAKTDGIAAYQLSFDLYENGVSRALRLDYGNFVLEGKLVRFESLPVAACKN